MRFATIASVELIQTPRKHKEESFASAVRTGLSKPQKTLPCRFFYDKTGSELFEQICDLPEYYPTRTEGGMLESDALQIIETAMQDGNELTLVEFGSGSSVKTRILLDATLSKQPYLQYSPIDISADFLLESAQALQQDYPNLSIRAVASEYQDALPHLPSYPLQSRLFLFLGSSIGNFDLFGAVAFLEQVSQHMTATDRLLIGFDRVKDISVLEAAYNDAAGVTAKFNKNLLTRINRELGGNFVLDQFDHHAPFTRAYNRIEMRLVSRCAQSVYIEALDQTVDFAKGEFIHTEDSHKHTDQSIAALAEATGLEIEATWMDTRSWYSLVMFSKSNV
ncbi:MAG: L-histidine N(alpha)-methyltransferase [Chloroflexota bacterium]